MSPQSLSFVGIVGQTGPVSCEVNAYAAAETPDERSAALDALAKILEPHGRSRVAAIAELQRRGILKAPGTRWTRPCSVQSGGPQKTGWTGCERGYLARVTGLDGTAFHAVVASDARFVVFTVLDLRQAASMSHSRQHARPGNHVQSAVVLDLHDYFRPEARPGRPAATLDGWRVVDDWPTRIPVTEDEVDVFEAWFGDILDELFGPV